MAQYSDLHYTRGMHNLQCTPDISIISSPEDRKYNGWDLNVWDSKVHFGWDPNVRDLNIQDLKVLAPLKSTSAFSTGGCPMATT